MNINVNRLAVHHPLYGLSFFGRRNFCPTKKTAELMPVMIYEVNVYQTKENRYRDYVQDRYSDNVRVIRRFKRKYRIEYKQQYNYPEDRKNTKHENQ